MAGKTVSTWDQMAVDYAKQRATSPAFLTEAPVVLKMLGDVRGKTALDVGCGSGDYSFLLQERGAFVVAIDSSEEMIRCARAEQARRGITERLFFEPQGLVSYTMAREIGAPTSFDVILCAHLLNHLADLSQAVALFNRVSNSRTVLVVTIPHPFNTAKAKEDSELVVEDYLTPRFIQEPWVLGGNKYITQYYHRPLSEYIGVFRDAGFTVVDMQEPKPGPDIKPRNEFDVANLERRQRLPSSLVIKGIRIR